MKMLQAIIKKKKETNCPDAKIKTGEDIEALLLTQKEGKKINIAKDRLYEDDRVLEREWWRRCRL